MARIERTSRLTEDHGAVLNSSEWSTIRHALDTAAEMYSDLAARTLLDAPAGPIPEDAKRVSRQFLRQVDECRALAAFIDDEGLT